MSICYVYGFYVFSLLATEPWLTGLATRKLLPRMSFTTTVTDLNPSLNATIVHRHNVRSGRMLDDRSNHVNNRHAFFYDRRFRSIRIKSSQLKLNLNISVKTEFTLI